MVKTEKTSSSRSLGRHFWVAGLATVFMAVAPGSPVAQLPDSLLVSQADQTTLIFGAEATDNTGWAVASGDVNGDGARDMVVASSGASPLGREDVGKIDIFWGGSAHADSIVLDGTAPGIAEIFGEGPYIGHTLSLAVGDFDGDGYDDIAIGLTQKPPFFNADGIVYVVFGSADFPGVIDLLYSTHRVSRIFPLPGSNGWFGYALASGDFDGDGFDELVIAQPFADGGGHIYLLFGDEEWPAVIDLPSTLHRLVRIDPRVSEQWIGQALAMGDVDSDGKSDLLIGDAMSAATLVRGRSDDVGVIDLGAEESSTTVIAPVTGFRGRLAFGDVDGDDRADIAVTRPSASPNGCPSCGAAYVIFGSNDLPAFIDLENPSTRISTLAGEQDYWDYGSGVTIADLTGDGFAEVAILVEPPTEDELNEVIVVRGGWSFPTTVALSTDTSVTRIIGLPKKMKFGYYALGSTDWDSDGISDLVVGSYRASSFGKFSTGRVYVFAGCRELPVGVSSPTLLGTTMKQNFPNPFNPNTTIEFSLASPQRVNLTIFDVAGRRVRTLVDEYHDAGTSRVTWDGRGNDSNPVSTGVYFYRLTAGSGVLTKKMTVLK